MKIQKDIHAISSISTIMSTADFEPTLFPEGYIEISKQLGLDVSEVVQVAQHIPLILRGTSHQESRKRLAVLIAEGARRARAVTETSLPGMISDNPRDNNTGYTYDVRVGHAVDPIN